MIVGHRVLEAPRLEARIAYHNLVHSRFGFAIAERRGLTVDADAVARKAYPMRPTDRLQLILPLAGRIGVRGAKGSYWLLPGQFSIERQGVYESRVRLEGALSTSVVFNWDPDWLSSRIEPFGPAPLSLRAFEAIRTAAGEIAKPIGAQAAAVALHHILETLRMEGIPFQALDPENLREEVPLEFHRCSAALDAAFASLSQAPMLIDMQERLTRFRRQRFTSIVSEMFRRTSVYETNITWRDLVRIWRMVVGIELMSAPRATTEGVAPLLGYSSPENFIRAFANAGLPSPGLVRRKLRAEAS